MSLGNKKGREEATRSQHRVQNALTARRLGWASRDKAKRSKEERGFHAENKRWKTHRRRCWLRRRSSAGFYISKSASR
jgi:hypothetical protein